MPDYTLVRFDKVRDTQKGDHVYRVALKDSNDALLQGGNPPTAIFPEMWMPKGQQPQTGPVSGDVSFNADFNTWQFKAQKPRGGGGGGWRGGSQPRDPAERASIEAQVAAKVAGEVAVELAKAGKLALLGSDEFHIAFARMADTAARTIKEHAKP